ncbi:MAG: hypothetical protein V7K48_33495 [Nostoc sp.]
MTSTTIISEFGRLNPTFFWCLDIAILSELPKLQEIKKKLKARKIQE